MVSIFQCSREPRLVSGTTILLDMQLLLMLDRRGTAIAVLCRAVAAIVWFGTQTYQGMTSQYAHSTTCSFFVQVANALKSCCAQSGLRSNPSRITFLLLLMSRLLRCYVSCEPHFPCLIKSRDLRRPVSSTLFSCLFYGFTSPSSVIFSWSRSLSCLSLALHYVSSFRSLRSTLVLIVIVGWAVGRAHGFGPVFSQGTNTTTSPAAVLFFSAMTSAIATKATLALNICVWSSQILLFQRLI